MRLRVRNFSIQVPIGQTQTKINSLRRMGDFRRTQGQAVVQDLCERLKGSSQRKRCGLMRAKCLDHESSKSALKGYLNLPKPTTACIQHRIHHSQLLSISCRREIILQQEENPESQLSVDPIALA